MIIKIILFLFFYSAVYGSTPRPQKLNELFKSYPSPATLSARYGNLTEFYYKNFTRFYKIAQGLTQKELERLLKNDEWLPQEGEVFCEEILNNIIGFFKSLLDKSKRDLKKTKIDKEEKEITCKNQLLEYYLPRLFYGLLFHKVTSATSNYYFLGQEFSFEGAVWEEQSYEITKSRNSNQIYSKKVNDNKNFYKSILDLFPKNLFNRYFTPFEILTLSSFLIKKFVQPSTAKKFLNNSFGSNFTKKQGVRYLEEYLLPHTGKLFIGAAMLHGLSGKIRSVKKELNKLEKIEF